MHTCPTKSPTKKNVSNERWMSSCSQMFWQIRTHTASGETTTISSKFWSSVTLPWERPPFWRASLMMFLLLVSAQQLASISVSKLSTKVAGRSNYRCQNPLVREQTRVLSNWIQTKYRMQPGPKRWCKRCRRACQLTKYQCTCRFGTPQVKNGIEP